MFFVLAECGVVVEGRIGVETDSIGVGILSRLPVSAVGVAVIGDVVLVQAE
jgi:hypothetical protein